MAIATTVFPDAKKLIDNNDYQGFALLVQQVMATSESYRTHQKGRGKPLSITSAINNHVVDGVKSTVKEDYERMRNDAKTAQEFWKQVPIPERAAFMKILASKLKTPEIAELMVFANAADVGKTTTDARKENGKALEWLDWAQDKNTLTKLETKVNGSHGRTLDTSGVAPVGLVGVVTSFNYPLALSMAGVIPGLLSGNAVMFKCSNKAPHWAFAFQDAYKSAMHDWLEEREANNPVWFRALKSASNGKLPELFQQSLFSVIAGRDNALITDVDNLFFVGGTDTGHKFEKERNDATALDNKPRNTHVELGGNAAVVVMDSAFSREDDGKLEPVNIEQSTNAKAEQIAKEIFTGNTGNSGQRCTKAAIVIAQSGEKGDLVLRKLNDLYVTGLSIGNPFDEKNQTGALVDKDARDKMEKLIEVARSVGATIHRKPQEALHNQVPAGGYYVSPALIDWSNIPEAVLKATPFSKDETLYDAITHETFAPVLHVVRRVESTQEAIEVANEYDKEKLAFAAFCDHADMEIFRTGIEATSKKHNAAPKDLSPKGEHGNFGHKFKSGGDNAFASFTQKNDLKIEGADQVQAYLAEIALMNGTTGLVK